jgi:hypothetical protein
LIRHEFSLTTIHPGCAIPSCRKRAMYCVGKLFWCLAAWLIPHQHRAMVIQKLHLSNCIEWVKRRLDILTMVFTHTAEDLDDDLSGYGLRLYGIGL